jgi:predicted nucleotide-binding protein
MSRRSTPVKPERPVHTVEEKRRDIERLSRRIKDLEALDTQSVTVNDRSIDPKVTELETAIGDSLGKVFGQGTVEYDRYIAAKKLDRRPDRALFTRTSELVITPDGERTALAKAREYLTDNKQQAITLLDLAIRQLKEEITDAEPSGEAVRTSKEDLAEREEPQPVALPAPVRSSTKVFIVHGHAGEPREAVARFLQRIGLEPIILHEQANQGQTVIEKFEAHADVGFAIVLLTPDDTGGTVGGDQQRRARQNVVLELGYFIGRLGRGRVCALKAGDLEMPSDILGIVSTSFDAGGAWRQGLAKELQAAKYAVDWNKFMA